MGQRREKRIRRPLRVWVSGLDYNGNHFEQSAKVIDLSERGARLDGIYCLKTPGDIIEIKHGIKKGRFRIAWIDNFQGQAGIFSLEPAKCIWGVSLPRSHKDDYESFTPADATKSMEHEQPKPAARQARTHARLPCAIAVTVRADGLTQPTWGTITRIGLGGCLIEGTAPLRRHAKVELLISGLEARPKGIVRYSAPSRGVGIMFTDLSDDSRQGLKDFLAALSRSRPQNKPGEDLWKD